MSQFFSGKFSSLKAYVPGEQPRERKYIKLNTNESPFPPSAGVEAAVRAECERLNLYSDPECTGLRALLAEMLGLSPENLIMTNGSDEALEYAFVAFGDESRPFIFPDITYGFYPVFCNVNGIPYEEKPLAEDFTVNTADYIGAGKNIVIANPNAPTGISLPLSEVEKIIASNPDNVVIIDEAYVDFGGESALPLIAKYDNLIVIRTYSKSRSMAGARLGFAAASAEIIRDMNTIKYSKNPYNVNRMTMAAGEAALRENDYYAANCREIIKTRRYTAEKLTKMGFFVLPSDTNFLFIRHQDIGGEELYLKLKERGILIRHFTLPRIAEYNRVTIGTRDEMDAFLREVGEVIK